MNYYLLGYLAIVTLFYGWMNWNLIRYNSALKKHVKFLHGELIKEMKENGKL